MSVKILVGDCLESMKAMSDQSVHCCVTSPPYWGLRDYGHAGQIGLEDTPEAYVFKMVEVFREVRRVLRDDGTCWINLGDSYAGGGGFSASAPSAATSKSGKYGGLGALKSGGIKPQGEIKPKDLVGIPWRVAFALQADGWWLRQDIIWHKPNPMPESVTDRCTKAHEYVFLLTKSERYFYDAEAVKEARADSNASRIESIERHGTTNGTPTGAAKLSESPYHAHKGARRGLHGVGTTFVSNDPAGRNRRSVWTITTKPYSGAHFAVMPPDLVEPCILAGTSEKGCCPACGKPWKRVMERVSTGKSYSTGKSKEKNDAGLVTGFSGYDDGSSAPVFRTTGWRPACNCGGDPVPCTVLDPFGGAGTTALVADQLHRNAILCELNPEYARLAENRITQDSPMFSDVFRT